MSDTAQVCVWDTSTGKRLAAFTGKPDFKSPDDNTFEVACAPDAKRVAFGDRDGRVRLLDATTGREERKWAGPVDGGASLAFSPDGRRLAAANWREIVIWEIDSSRELKRRKNPGLGFGVRLAFTPDGKELIVAGQDTRVLDAATGAERAVAKTPRFDGRPVISPDGSLIAGTTSMAASAFRAREVTVWDRAAGKASCKLSFDEDKVDRLVFGPGGLLGVFTYTGAGKNELEVWDVRSGRRLSRSPGYTAAFSPDGKTLAVDGRGPDLKPEIHLIDLAGLVNESFQSALAPAKAAGAEIDPDGDGIRVRFWLQGPDAVAALTALRGLPIPLALVVHARPPFTDEMARAMAGIVPARSIKIDIEEFRDDHLKLIAGLPNLHALDLSGCRSITSVGIAALDKADRLERLTLSDTKADAAAVKTLVGLKRLSALDVSRTEIGDESAAAIAAMPALREFSSHRITDAGLAAFKGKTSLRRLSVGSGVTDAGLANVADLTGLEGLALPSADVSDTGLAHLKGLTHLGTLDLSNTKVTDAGFVHLKSLTRLYDLRVDGLTGLTGPGLAHLRTAKGLTILDLVQTGVTDDGLAGVKDLVQLKQLLLPVKTTDTGLLHLGKLTELEWVNVQYLKQLNGSGLAAVKGMTRVTKLDLREHAITDAGLVGLRDWKHLEDLQLPPGVTDGGLKNLTGLDKLRTLYR
ncbi:MAG TPA: hypothetical protein VH092_29310 [Urbifossiella sp.]|nr:hypothetical protein [Urbifossiella sp.]